MRDNISVSASDAVAVKLTRMRQRAAEPRDPDRYLDCGDYRQMMREIGMLLAAEVGTHLQVKKTKFDGPNGKATGTELRGNYSVVVPILRTGLVLAEGFQSVLSHTHTGHIGLHRDKQHPDRELIEYLVVLPNADPPDRHFIVIDAVVATGDTADRALAIVKEHGATNISFVSVIASKPGIDRLASNHSDVKFHVAAIDRNYDKNGRVIPGLGSVSEFLFGFKTAGSAYL